MIDTYYDAFDGHPFLIRVYGPRSKEMDAHLAKSMESEIQDPNSRYLVLTELNSKGQENIIALGKWLVLTPTSPPSPPLALPAEADVAFVEGFLGVIIKKHKEIMQDRPHWYLDVLGVRRGSRRQGAGQQLLRWGLSKADQDGVETFLAASPAGVPLYEKNGFKIMEQVLLDEGTRLETFMVRPAKKA